MYRIRGQKKGKGELLEADSNLGMGDGQTKEKGWGWSLKRDQMYKEKLLGVGAGTSEFREGTKESRLIPLKDCSPDWFWHLGTGEGAMHNKAGLEAFEKNKLEIRSNCYFQDKKLCQSNADRNRK